MPRASRPTRPSTRLFHCASRCLKVPGQESSACAFCSCPSPAAARLVWVKCGVLLGLLLDVENGTVKCTGMVERIHRLKDGALRHLAVLQFFQGGGVQTAMPLGGQSSLTKCRQHDYSILPSCNAAASEATSVRFECGDSKLHAGFVPPGSGI